MSTKAFKKWVARIEDTTTPWSEQEVIYFRKAIGSAGLKDAAERGLLRRMFNEKALAEPGYRITAAHDIKGQQYMLSKSLKLNGTVRRGNKLGQFELAVMKNLSHHLFVGLYRPQENLNYFLPIYRAISITGAYFDYVGATYEMVKVINAGPLLRSVS